MEKCKSKDQNDEIKRLFFVVDVGVWVGEILSNEIKRLFVFVELVRGIRNKIFVMIEIILFLLQLG